MRLFWSVTAALFFVLGEQVDAQVLLGAEGLDAPRISASSLLVHDLTRGERAESEALSPPNPDDSDIRATETDYVGITAQSSLSGGQMSPRRARAERRVERARRMLSGGLVVSAPGEFQAAITLDPTYVDAYIGLAEAYSRQRRFDDAEEALRIGVRRLPRDTSLRFAMAQILSAQGLEQEALELLLDWLESAPQVDEVRVAEAALTQAQALGAWSIAYLLCRRRWRIAVSREDFETTSQMNALAEALGTLAYPLATCTEAFDCED